MGYYSFGHGNLHNDTPAVWWVGVMCVTCASLWLLYYAVRRVWSLLSTSCVCQQFRPNDAWRKARDMSAFLSGGYKIGTKTLCAPRWKAIFKIYFLSSLVKTSQWHDISLEFHPLFCLFLFLSWPKEILPVALRKWTNTHASFLWRCSI